MAAHGRSGRLSTDDLRAGTELGEYVLVSPLGEGGFASVWLAQHRFWSERKVAAKIIRDRDQLEQLKTEARCLDGLVHPNIAGALGIDLDHEPPYLLVELHEGRTLRKLLEQDGPLPAPRAKKLFAQIVAALAASHAHGIAHGDLKPENILVADGDRVKVADFGLGRVKARQASVLLSASMKTQGDARSIAGTIPYMAPEQQAGEAADSRTDVFTLGVLLHEMTSGARPQPGDELAGSLAADATWRAAFARCYTRRDRRFEDAGQLAAALGEAPATVRAAPAPEPAPAPTEAAAPLWTPEQIEKAVATEAECTLEQLRRDSFWVGARGLTVTSYLLHHNLGMPIPAVAERYGMPAKKIRSKLSSGVNGEVLKGVGEALAPLPPDVARRLAALEQRMTLWIVLAVIAVVLALAALGGAIAMGVQYGIVGAFAGVLGSFMAVGAALKANVQYDESRDEVDGLVPSIPDATEKARLARLAMRYDMPLVRRRAQKLLDGTARPAQRADDQGEDDAEREDAVERVSFAPPFAPLEPVSEPEHVGPARPLFAPVPESPKRAEPIAPARLIDVPPPLIQGEAPRRPPIVIAPTSPEQSGAAREPRRIIEE